MGFNKVYKSLMEIFPQIDARVLRAVAIDHSKDISVAVDAVFQEVIPFLSSLNAGVHEISSGATSVGGSSEDATPVLSAAPAPLPVHTSVGEPSKDNDHKARSCHGLGLDAGAKLGDELSSRDANDEYKKLVPDTCNGHHEGDKSTDEDGINGVSTDVSGDLVANKTIPADELLGMLTQNFPYQMLETPGDDDKVEEKLFISEGILQHANSAPESAIAANKESDQTKFSSESNHFVLDSITGSVNESESSIKFSMRPDLVGTNDSGESDENPIKDNVESSSSTFGSRQESTLSFSISQSSQKHTTEVVEELILNAKDNKKALSDALQSVRSLMKEVELKEQAAERARMEAVTAAAGSLVKLGQLRQMVQQAEEEKSSFAGEVYGEKAIQATELTALHNRVLLLSDERDKSLSLVHEMRQTLEIRLVAAEKEIISVEHEKEENEKAAMEACAMQELALESVLEEMETLKQLAKDNAMMQEFLLDRGCLVDALQGEIALAHKDVKQLKEKLDENVPLAKLLSSSQFNSKLGSSSLSSSRSSTPAVTAAVVETIKEDGWEICEAPISTALN